ncbi:MAG: YvcK family protein [Proteobacteria bacterium]|nr:YvcK family protein [Pseudomonadota bacterium]
MSPLDLLPHDDLREKLVELILSGVPPGLPSETANGLQQLRDALASEPVQDLNVVVFGGGTGLSTIVGGDSRSSSWARNPFSGMKSLFPKTRSIVCVTDDGGSTGELLKDLPLIALGDIRHVLLSSIQLSLLHELYGLTEAEATRTVSLLATVFNYRFSARPENSQQLLRDCGLAERNILPKAIQDGLEKRISLLFDDARLHNTLSRPHCLGNLILAASIYKRIPDRYDNIRLASEPVLVRKHLYRGIALLCALLGADELAVLPCTSVPAQLSLRYTNGAQLNGEYKSGHTHRGYPIDRAFVNFCGEPDVSSSVFDLIEGADIMIMAPGSLYSSLIPVFQVPGIADAVKKNHKALKILVSNLWVQTGETDLSMVDPERKFHLSDLLKAYERNIPGGTRGLFDQVLCLSLKNVPATVLQNYAVEGKIPIYLDREKVRLQGIVPLECGMYSPSVLLEHGVIRHDAEQFSLVIRTLWATFHHVTERGAAPTNSALITKSHFLTTSELPSIRYRQIRDYLAGISIELRSQTGKDDETLREILQDIIWNHKDIPLAHLQLVKGIQCIETEEWKRNQKWDRVYSFFDPYDGLLKIRQDQFRTEGDLEVAFLVALGQSLLGDYFQRKEMLPVTADGIILGKAYHLYLKPLAVRDCYLSNEDLSDYLALARMVQDPDDANHYTRLINGEEGFTPPGLLFGLTYAWYLDNRFASHIEYKMAVMKVDHTDLIPEQVKMRSRRESLIVFFREVVFGH